MSIKAVIMAGGRGSRMANMTDDCPKPMVRMLGKPILEYEIECLRRQGITDIIISVSYLSEVIVNYFGDGSGISPATKEPFGVHIEYYIEDFPLGNAGALFCIKDKLSNPFLLLNADLVFDIDFAKFINAHTSFGGVATLFTHPNNHPYDSGLIISDKSGRVTNWLSKEDERPEWYKNRVNAGIHVLSTDIFSLIQKNNKLIQTVNQVKIDLDRDILKPLLKMGKVYSYDSPEYVKDMGTIERFSLVKRDYENGLVKGRNLTKKQKAVFLDRDGTINKYVGFLTDINDFELIEYVPKAIKIMNELGYLVIVVTNQPVIARGELSEKGLEEIHNKMETLLGEQGAYVDAIYYCPHHPDSGYEGEVKELKVECECRKPKPGMLIQAAVKFNIDLNQSYMVGDSENDVLAGKAAGCLTVLIDNGINNETKNEHVAASLLDFATRILEGNLNE